MAESILRRGFLRQLVSLPMLGGGVALLGAPTAVAEPVTPQLIAADHRWLELERYLLCEERPPIDWPADPRPSMVGWSNDEVARYMRAEENVARIKADFMAEHCHFRARAKIGWEIDSIASVDRSFLKGDAIVSPPASSRAALVLSAVGVDWRG
jgi:hypothetical protein